MDFLLDVIATAAIAALLVLAFVVLVVALLIYFHDVWKYRNWH